MRRVAAIDIGSNSVRLVVYGVVGSALISLFDEKAQCGLGRNLAFSGVLDPEGRAQALQELRRFAELAVRFDVEALFPFATAAVREASDGGEFVDRVGRETGLTVEVISGLDEARFAALGVAGAIPATNGIVGDLGGGSLELVRLADGEVQDQATLPIGALLRPVDATPATSMAWIDNHLKQVGWLANADAGDLYLVGGAWRAFARAHMRHVDHPLSVIHEYAMSTSHAAGLARLIGVMGERSVALLASVSRRRRSMMPYAAQVLLCMIAAAKPTAVVASGHGLREGFIRHRLDLGGGDPLLDYCRFAGAATARIAPDGNTIARWLLPLFPDLDRKRDGNVHRWIEAACHLADLAGRDHPDRRADIAYARGANLPAVAISHTGRAFLGHALRARYGGKDEEDAPFGNTLLTPDQTTLAERVGAVLRLAYAVSPNGANLGEFSLTLAPDELELAGPHVLLGGETVGRRLRGAAAAFGVKSTRIN